MSAVKYYKVTVRFYTALGSMIARSWKIKEHTGVIIPNDHDLAWNVYDSYENAKIKRGLLASVSSESFWASVKNTMCQTSLDAVVLSNDEEREPTQSELRGEFEYDSDSDSDSDSD
jgi:hypothetical protein